MRKTAIVINKPIINLIIPKLHQWVIPRLFYVVEAMVRKKKTLNSNKQIQEKTMGKVTNITNLMMMVCLITQNNMAGEKVCSIFLVIN